MKKELEKGLLLLGTGRKALSLQPLLHCLDLLKSQPDTQVLGVKHVGNQVAGLDDVVKSLLDIVAVILQDRLIEEVHEDVADINGGLVTLPQV